VCVVCVVCVVCASMCCVCMHVCIYSIYSNNSSFFIHKIQSHVSDKGHLKVLMVNWSMTVCCFSECVDN